MKSKCGAQEPDQRSFVLILDAGDEAFASISRFAEREGLHGVSLTAFGAFEKAKVGWFDPKECMHKPIPID
jgi:uncharacterized protein